MSQEHHTNQPLTGSSLTLHARPERTLLQTGGSVCYIDLHLQVAEKPVQQTNARLPLHLALVLDRSGSMQGEKLSLAKRATLAVLDQLTPRDSVAVVVFDDRIDVVQTLDKVTPSLKSRLQKSLAKIEARANTALHEGWLTGCNALVRDAGLTREEVLGRCFLLTDGIANVGITDPEHIAGEAAGIRENTGISTSTFGIGSDYNELLLGPMAVAGGGQFHHLRTPEEIFHTFVGELGELLSTGARQVRLEFELESGLTMELVSAYWLDEQQHAISVGDLQYGAEQHVVMRVSFPAQWNAQRRTVRVRLAWVEENQQQHTPWQELHFSYASDEAYAQEVCNSEVVQQANLQEADRARREALALNKRGDYAGAQAVVQSAIQQVAQAAPASAPLKVELDALEKLHKHMAAPMAPGASKEEYYKQQLRSRNKRDYRSSSPDEQNP